MAILDVFGAISFCSTNLIYQVLLGKGGGEPRCWLHISRKVNIFFLNCSQGNYIWLLSAGSLKLYLCQNSAPAGVRENRCRTQVNIHICFWKKGTEAAQTEVKEIIAGLNNNTFYLWAEGQLTAGGLCRPILLEFRGGPPFLSGDSCKPAAHSITIRHWVLSRNADMYRSSFVSSDCTPPGEMTVNLWFQMTRTG